MNVVQGDLSMKPGLGPGVPLVCIYIQISFHEKIVTKFLTMSKHVIHYLVSVCTTVQCTHTVT